MESKHLTYFKVENFKRFDSLEVSDIGQFNLIVGDNNVGKTTLLEALLFDHENYDQFLVNLELALENRELATDKKINYIDSYISNKGAMLKYIFHNDGIKYELIVTKKNKHELTEKDLNSDIIVQLKLNDSPNFVQIALNDKSDVKVVSLLDENKEINFHFPFLGPKNIYDEEAFDFAATISESYRKLEIFKNELKYFLPNIISIEAGTSIINGDSIIIIRETNSDNPFPLQSYGDGFIKFFRCLLKMELSSNKRLMIDEIDTGIHYSRMKEFLKKVIQSAKNKNVQIFATTHSKECIEYYTQALKELGYEKEGRIIRIADTKSGIKAYTMNYEQFENSLIAESEIR